MKKRLAFTLAEVLITLGIIGAVAVMTLPNVTASYQKRMQVTALQRTYNMITTAVANYMNDKRIDDLTYSDLTTLDGVEEFLRKYFDVVKICKKNSAGATPAQCLAETYNNFDKSSTFGVSGLSQISKSICAVINTGATICMDEMRTAGHSYLYIDTNGVQKPNVAGRDFFGKLNLWSDGSMMGINFEPSTGANCPNFEATMTSEKMFAASCFAKIQKDGWQMNY